MKFVRIFMSLFGKETEISITLHVHINNINILERLAQGLGEEKNSLKEAQA